MNTPELNPGGYINASMTKVEPFKKVDYLLAHGTGDDNVHFANSAHLLDMFVKGHVRDYAFRMFTDRCVESSRYLFTWLTVSIATTLFALAVRTENYTSS